MKILLLLQQPPNGWDRFTAWFLANWFTAVIIVIGVVLFIMLATSIWVHVKTIGVVGTVVLIISTAVLIFFAMWIIMLIVPAAVGFGPKLWNKTMAAAGNQPALVVPGDKTVGGGAQSGGGFGSDQTGGGQSGGGQTGGSTPSNGLYDVQSPTSDGCLDIHEGPAAGTKKTNCIPNGTDVRVVNTVPSGTWNGSSYFCQLEASLANPGGWVHCGGLRYVGP